MPSDNSTRERKDTPVGLDKCPECNRNIINIKSCPLPALKSFLQWQHLCVANNVFRWCGTFGSLHVDIYKASVK